MEQSPYQSPEAKHRPDLSDAVLSKTLRSSGPPQATAVSRRGAAEQQNKKPPEAANPSTTGQVKKLGKQAIMCHADAKEGQGQRTKDPRQNECPTITSHHEQTKVDAKNQGLTSPHLEDNASPREASHSRLDPLPRHRCRDSV